MSISQFFSIALLAAFASNSYAFIVTMTASSDGNEKPTISGTTNLPDGVDLMVTISRKESSYMAQDKVKVSGGKFHTVSFSQNNGALNSGTYSLEIGTPMASVMPPKTWPVIGNDGEKLEGPLVKKASFGGKLVKYKTTFKIGSGKSSSQNDQAARKQDAKNTHEWWLKSCKDTCALTEAVANKRGEAFNMDRCYYKCVADEPKR